MLVAQNSLGPVCPVPLTVRGRVDGVMDQPETPAETCYPGALVPEANDDDVGGTEAPTDVQNAVAPEEPSLLVPDALTALPVAEMLAGRHRQGLPAPRA